MSLVDSRYGKFNIIDDDLVISKSIRLYGEWAQNEIEFLLCFIKSGDSVADVGAFIGTHSRAFSSSVGENGKVYSFEPRVKIFEFLNKNSFLSEFSNIHPYLCGLGAKRSAIISPDQSQEMHNYGAFSLKDIKSSDDSDGGIDVYPLDSLLISHLDFIKIDVEGMEVDVLHGADNTIRRDRPVIYAEVNSIDAGRDLLVWSNANQYLIFCTIHPAFNADNFARNVENFFSDAVEVGAVLLPSEKIENYQSILSESQMIPVKTADDFAAVLFCKPQYFHEILKNSASAAILWESTDINFANLLAKWRGGKNLVAKCCLSVSDRENSADVEPNLTLIQCELNEAKISLHKMESLALERHSSLIGCKCQLSFSEETIQKLTILIHELENSKHSLLKGNAKLTEKQSGWMRSALRWFSQKL